MFDLLLVEVVVEVIVVCVRLEWQEAALLLHELGLDIAVASRERPRSSYHWCRLPEMVIPVLLLLFSVSYLQDAVLGTGEFGCFAII